MKLARVIRLDESDLNIFDPPCDIGELAISGAFAFSDWSDDHLTGKARQAFANGWLGLETFGRATFVAVTPVTGAEYDAAINALAAHFVGFYGAPDPDAARPVAENEVRHMAEMCADHDTNTLMVVERTLEAEGVREKFRVIAPQSAPLEAFAVHGSLD